MAVTSPISYSQHRDKTSRAYISIVFIWLLSIGIGKNKLPRNIYLIDSPNKEVKENPILLLKSISKAKTTPMHSRRLVGSTNQADSSGFKFRFA